MKNSFANSRVTGNDICPAIGCAACGIKEVEKSGESVVATCKLLKFGSEN